MSTPQLDDDKLQRYFDDELPESEAEKIRRAIEESDEERARLQQLERLRELMRMAADDAAFDIGSDELYAKVREGIDRHKRAGFGEGLRAVEGGKSGEPRRKTPPRRGAWIAGTALAAAAAVAIVVMARPGEPEQSEVARTEVPAETAPTDKATTPSSVEIEAPGGSEVVEVDFGKNTGTVFEVPGDAGEAIAVVWIDDEEAL